MKVSEAAIKGLPRRLRRLAARSDRAPTIGTLELTARTIEQVAAERDDFKAAWDSAVEWAVELKATREVTEEEVAEALQLAWNDWCMDTGSVPDCFTIHGPRTTQVTGDFSRGNFAGHIASWINANRDRLASDGRQER